jgi:hypothetical protein
MQSIARNQTCMHIYDGVSPTGRLLSPRGSFFFPSLRASELFFFYHYSIGSWLLATQEQAAATTTG